MNIKKWLSSILEHACESWWENSILPSVGFISWIFPMIKKSVEEFRADLPTYLSNPPTHPSIHLGHNSELSGNKVKTFTHKLGMHFSTLRWASDVKSTSELLVSIKKHYFRSYTVYTMFQLPTSEVSRMEHKLPADKCYWSQFGGVRYSKEV